MAQQEIDDFVKRFLPDVPLPKANMLVTPHGLLYDFNGHFPTVRFTCTQLRDCLEGYLGLIDSALASIPTQTIEAHQMSLVHWIYQTRHMDASELLLAYFQRTPKDDDFPTLVAYIKTSHAYERVAAFLDVLEPSGQYRGDGTQRIFSIRDVLKHLSEQS